MALCSKIFIWGIFFLQRWVFFSFRGVGNPAVGVGSGMSGVGQSDAFCSPLSIATVTVARNGEWKKDLK